ncbi:2OG-Fe(II) oxygenase [Rhodanobacter sp. L36]|uniref:2OG-Fe(II) oxygenase n=1 Tax=Rhodanobacter sp. L36 TaxID=1747221 RepID=UPI00131C652B|nr:2OG-Fe(II) oxygenase [Rhodanobacter sp. L36]
MTPRSDEFDTASATLAADGWCLIDHLLSPMQTLALADECHALHDAQRLTPAHVGSGRVRSLLRGDSTLWFEPDALSDAQQVFSDRIDVLRIALNQNLLLGLVDEESHYAMYTPGADYARHLDRLHGNDARVISAVFYLNDAWLDAEGGALRLHLADLSHRDIYPRSGTLLLFLSAQFEHEVLPATRNRMSVACWLRQRPMMGD